MFNIRPINRVSEKGTVEMIDRTRKREEGLDKLLRFVETSAGNKPLHFMVCHAAVPEMASRLCEDIGKRFDCLGMILTDYSPVMGYGAGPGAIFIGFHPEVELG